METAVKTCHLCGGVRMIDRHAIHICTHCDMPCVDKRCKVCADLRLRGPK